MTAGGLRCGTNACASSLKLTTMTAQTDPGAPRALPMAPPYLLVQARHGWMLANPNDFYLGKAIVEYGEYGEIEARFLSQLFVRPGAIVEVGANVGTHTIALAKQAAAQHRSMVVFEPQPFLFQNLCANLSLNGLSNVRAWPWACGATTGTLHFDEPDYGAQGNFGGLQMQADAGQRSVAVPCVRLDDVLPDQEVALLKIDVEGAELSTLQGAVRLLERSRPVLYVENDRLEQSSVLIEWLWSQNYRLWWHTPMLFNPDNYFGNTHNLYGNAASFNMLCLPRESGIVVEALHEVTDASVHPCGRV